MHCKKVTDENLADEEMHFFLSFLVLKRITVFGLDFRVNIVCRPLNCTKKEMRIWAL